MLYPAFLSPLRAARTECGCQPVADCKAARSAPALRLSSLRRIAVLVSRSGVDLGLDIFVPRVLGSAGCRPWYRDAPGVRPGLGTVTLVSGGKSSQYWRAPPYLLSFGTLTPSLSNVSIISCCSAALDASWASMAVPTSSLMWMAQSSDVLCPFTNSHHPSLASGWPRKDRQERRRCRARVDRG